MPSSDILLEARNLGRRRPDGDCWLLEGVSLAIHPGDRLALAGPSGAGKTLLLRSLALLDPIDQGEIVWRGHRISNQAVPSFRKAVICLHQRAALLEDTVEAALRRPFALKVRRRKNFDRDRVIELLATLGRDDSFLKKSAADLSGGEIQITALVRALQLDPTILLLDEPTAALDLQTTLAVEALLGQWVADRSAGRAMVWVGHDARQAERVGGLTVRMEGGKIS